MELSISLIADQKHVYKFRMANKESFIIDGFTNEGMVPDLHLPLSKFEDAIYVFITSILKDDLFNKWIEMESFSLNSSTGAGHGECH